MNDDNRSKASLIEILEKRMAELEITVSELALQLEMDEEELQMYLEGTHEFPSRIAASALHALGLQVDLY